MRCNPKTGGKGLELSFGISPNHPFTVPCKTSRADTLMNSAITCGALSRDQFGGRPEHSAFDALIKSFGPVTDTLDAKNGCTSRLIPRPFMATHDIKGAFNNTRPGALIQIMTSR
jgi:hypothetical protein